MLKVLTTVLLMLKISKLHLDAKESQRQNVRMAAQIFSNRNAMAIQWCGENGLLKSSHWKETANILSLFNAWFDVFNSKIKYGQHSGVNAYGINLNKQTKTINEMTQFIEQMRVGKSSLLQFQKEILLFNKSLTEMFSYIQG